MNRVITALMLVVAFHAAASTPEQDALQTRACNDGFFDACDDVGNHNVGTWAIAESLFVKGCLGGIASSCMWLGFAGIERKNTISAPEFKGKTPADLYQQACKAGNDDGCTRLCIQKMTGLGAPKDEKGAKPICTTACTLGSSAACEKIGATYSSHSDRTAILNPACGSGSLSACYALAKNAADGENAKKDKAQAQKLFTKACNGGHAAACVELARMLPEKDKAGAAKLYERGCKGANMYACASLADLVKEGVKSPLGTDELKARACTLGYLSACPGK